MQKYLTALVCASLMVGEAAAQEKAPDQWNYEVLVYLWGSSIKGDTITGDEIDVGFTTIIKNLDFAAMGAFSARKNKFSIVSDVIYMNLGDTIKTDKEFLGRPVAAELDLGLTSWVLNFGAGYKYKKMDGVFGYRYLRWDFEKDADVFDTLYFHGPYAGLKWAF